MNGPLLFTLVHIIRTLECTEHQNTTNGTLTEKQKNHFNGTEKEITNWQLSEIGTLQDQCSCPCSGVRRVPVCGKTTNGLLKTFDSQCHLICHNQCGSSERYAIIIYHECPLFPILPPAMSRKNMNSILYENRRNDMVLPSAYSAVITPMERQCDCSYCPQTRWIRLDYYPICGERSGQKTTFSSWCHFDCENKCIRHTESSYIYSHRGPCQLKPKDEIEIPRSFNAESAEFCNLCNYQCKNVYEPVCTKNYQNEFLSFESHCHLRCYNQCHHDTKDSFIYVFDGQCPWM